MATPINLSSYVILDTVQAAHADLTLDNRIVRFGDPLVKVCDYQSLIPGACSLTVSVAEVLQQTTLTPVAANSSTYSFRITQFNINTGTNIVREYFYTTAAAGDDATSICDALRDQVNADTIIQVTATGAATLILTADAGYPIFTVTILQTGGGFTQATGTAGVRSVNTDADLTRMGITGFTGTAYTNLHLEFYKQVGDLNTIGQGQHWMWDAYVDEGEAQYGDLLTYMEEMMAGVNAGAATTDPNTVSLLDT